MGGCGGEAFCAADAREAKEGVVRVVTVDMLVGAEQAGASGLKPSGCEI